MSATYTKHVPLRRCASCAAQAPKRDLLRIVRSPDGALLLDPSGKAPGRGVYVCKQPACWEQAVKKDRLARAVKTELTPAQRAAILQALHRHVREVAA